MKTDRIYYKFLLAHYTYLKSKTFLNEYDINKLKEIEMKIEDIENKNLRTL